MAFLATAIRFLNVAALAATPLAISMSGGRIGATRYGSQSPVANYTGRAAHHAGARIAARPGQQPASSAWQDAPRSAALEQLALVQLAAQARRGDQTSRERLARFVALNGTAERLVGGKRVAHSGNEERLVEVSRIAFNGSRELLVEGNAMLACAMAEKQELERLGSRPATLVREMDDLCDYSMLLTWGERQDAQSIFQTWQAARPNGLVYAVDNDEGCLVRGLTGVGLDSPVDAEPQVLSLVHSSGNLICNARGMTFQTFRPEQFEVPKALWSRGKHRNFGMVWPPKKECNAKKPCPVVFFLSGIGEHSNQGNVSEMNAAFRKIAKFGFLRYAERDPTCFNDLGSVLIFVQLDIGEDWMNNGPELMEHYLVPLWEKLSSEREGLDPERVSIMGYSEGAFGALQAAAQRPDVFTLAVAASASTSDVWWRHAPIPRLKRDHHFRPMSASARDEDPNFRLKMVMVGLGEHDSTGAQNINLHHITKWLDSYGVTDQAALEVRYYAGLRHKDVWDRLFNRWQRFHAVFWQGDYSQLQYFGY